MHAAQGTTVDTSHTVVTPQTGHEAFYVGMSRGRARNTAHITTVTGPDDPAHGRDDQAIHRDPVAAVAAILDPDGSTAAQSALATATRSADETTAVRTPAELFTDAAQLAATHRTAIWLDELTADGTLTLHDRRRIAAEDGTASLTRVLRSAEVAGHDPRAVLTAAIADRPLDGARNTTNVIYSRIADRHRFDPVGTSWEAWMPRVDNPDWQRYLAQLAHAVDNRTIELGRAAATEPPTWALAAFGAPPIESDARDAWVADVGAVAAYRELRDHASETDVLGPVPQPGQVEQFAAYRAAWRVLGRPEVDREELELSDGQLRMRVRAAERETAWAPRYVGNELAGTRQAAEHHRQSAALRLEESSAAPDTTAQAELRVEAEQARALADTLDQQIAQLEQLDKARSQWLAHTAATRAAGERAQAELALRHADAEPEQRVTAEEWLHAHRDALRADEEHQEITAEYELAPPHPADQVAAPSDIREDAGRERPHAQEDTVRVPTAAETAAALDRAHRAMAEIEARDAYEQEHEAADRAAELNAWGAEDRSEEHTPDEALDYA